MRIPTVLLLLAVSRSACGAAEADRTAWQWQAPVEVGQAGLVRLELTPPVLDATQQGLQDLRVLSPAGVETPYMFSLALGQQAGVRDAGGFKVVLSGRTTVIELAGGSEPAIDALQLVSPAREFLKSATIEGREEGGEWQTLATDEMIFRQAGGAERLLVPVPAGAWRNLRCTLDDERSQPVPFTGVRVREVRDKGETVELPVVLGTRTEVAGETRLMLDLGARNLHVAEICFEIGDAVFGRPCKLAFFFPEAWGTTHAGAGWGGTLYRVTGERGVAVENLVIPMSWRLPSRYLVATFSNGDSPPLTITGARIRVNPMRVVFHAAEAGTWHLLTGNRSAPDPHYDFNPLRAGLGAAGGQRITPGPLQAKADYQMPPPLRAVKPVGADIGLADWTRRRPVLPLSGGVIRIELDALTLAGCRQDLGDVRLVVDGRQLPYLVKPGTVMRDLKPSRVAQRHDPKRPTVSRWEITLPVDGLPALDLTAKSPAPLFARRFVALIERKDEPGHRWSENAGAADWTKAGGADTPLVLPLGRTRLPSSFVLETDHGDNPPIAVDEITVRYAAPTLAAKVPDGAALFLCYGNPKAVPPQYDLRLARDELLAADQQPAMLGEEEQLRPAARGARGVDAGSPWLWLALGGVVVALLVIVARLLPQSAGLSDKPDGAG